MTRVAVVDVGTNSVRLMVGESATQAGTPLRVLQRQLRITRLGTGVDRHGHLDDAALARTLDCITDYAECWRELAAERVRIAATSAVRDAVDRARFFDGVRAVAGVDAEVLSGDEEARLSFLGATAAISALQPYLVVDIGGGSTEFIRGTTAVAAAISRQLGCVRLTERCLHSDPPTSAEIGAATADIDAHLDAVAAAVDPAAAVTLVGVAGTVTTLAALHLGLMQYEPDRIHGTRVSVARIVELTHQLADLPAARRAELGPIPRGRADVILGGALILQRVMQRFAFAEVHTSEADLLDGLAMRLLET